jgi:hypothetical protein
VNIARHQILGIDKDHTVARAALGFFSAQRADAVLGQLRALFLDQQLHDGRVRMPVSLIGAAQVRMRVDLNNPDRAAPARAAHPTTAP